MYNRPPPDRYAADRTANDIEGQNDEALEGLSQKVKLLKNVSRPRLRPGALTAWPEQLVTTMRLLKQY